MRMTRIAGLTGAFGIAICLSEGAVRAACPEGTIQVGERRVPQGNVITVHPVCRRVQPIAPSAPGEPFRLGAVEDAVDFRAETPDRDGLTDEQLVRMPLVNGTSFATGPGGRARLVFPDGTTLALGASTRFVVENLPDARDPNRQGRLNLAQGFARWSHDARRRIERAINRRFGIRIGRVAVAVRGTDFDMSLAPDGTGFIRVRSGSIDYRTAEDGAPRELRAGQTLRLERGTIVGVR